MHCPTCHHEDTRVLETRVGREGNSIRRRRECDHCQYRFTTVERVEFVLPMIIKKDGSRESYDRERVLSGFNKACEKRPVSVEAIEAAASEIEMKLQEMGEKEVKSSIIGETIMDKLKQLDGVAYVRFASVYREFKDIEDFMKELKAIR